MTRQSQKRAVANNRRRLKERGMRRFEVRGLEKDKDLLRGLAKHLSVGGIEADRLRKELSHKILGATGSGLQIHEWLRRSPLVGADLDLSRDVTHGRDVDL